MSDVKTYFEQNAHNHAYHNDPDVYKYIVTLMDNLRNANTKIKVLDIGCGDGAFIKSLINSSINAEYTATDISLKMINFAKENLNNNDIFLMVSDAFDIPISKNYKFDLIHIDSVLHHLIGKNRAESKRLADKLLNRLNGHLTKDGKIIVEEVYYDSYFLEEFTSICIFYGLKMLNRTRIDINKLMAEFHKGLEVRFFSQRELMNLLRNHGNPVVVKDKSWKIPKLYKLFFLKRTGHVTYLVNKT